MGKGLVIDLPGEIKDVLVGDPKIANAVVRTSRRAYIIGVAVGQTNVYFFDAYGVQLMAFDIAVKRDLNGIRADLRKALPEALIQVEGLGANGIILNGSAASQAESQRAYDIAVGLVGDGKVVNNLVIRERDQVMLKVTVAEVKRDVIKQLGIDLNGSVSNGMHTVTFNNPSSFPINQPLSSNNITLNSHGVQASLRAMERAGIVRTLAEPTLTAISGESADFLAGGEFPVPTGSTCNPPGSNQCTVSVTFKKFGVGLSFTPVVLSEGRISLRVLSEVSELSSDGAVQTGAITVPSLTVRRAQTTVELPSGGSLAMAGMIQAQTKQQLNGIPGLMNLPVLGTLFKSRDFINHQSELVILVSPYVVRAVAQKDLSKPDDGYADASDAATILLGRFNRLYGVPGKNGPRREGYYGDIGFILD